MYAALSFETCIVETLVRDRFIVISVSFRWQRSWRAATREFRRNPIANSICWIFEIPAVWISARLPMPFAPDTSRRARPWEGRSTKSMRTWTVIYASRLTGHDCIAVFSRVKEKFAIADACELKDHPELPAVLQLHRIQLVDD
jgi:hypothetical protein